MVTRLATRAFAWGPRRLASKELTKGIASWARMRFSCVSWAGRQTQRGVTTVAKGKRTFQPNNRRRARVHGFRLRMRTRAGRAIVSARRGKGRRSLTA